MPKLEPHGPREEEGEPEGEPRRGGEIEPEPQVEEVVKLWKRVALCITFALLPLTLLFIGCVTLGAYTTDKVHKVNSEEWSVWVSNTEALRISDITNKELRWYSGDVCIEKVSTNDYQKQVEVSLVRITCSEVKKRRVYENITKEFTHGSTHQLSFFWTADTEILLQMRIGLIPNITTTRWLNVYVIKTTDQRRECVARNMPIGYLHRWQFNYNGTSSENTNCTSDDNITAECSSPLYGIDKTDRYLVCMFSSLYGESWHHHVVTYTLQINGSVYDLSDTAPYENKECRLDQSQCCNNYGSVFQEMYEPTCVFIHNTAPSSSLEANELSFPMKVKPHSKWDAVVACWLLAFVFALCLVLSIVCIVGRVKYHKAHPDRYCAELKIAGHNCLRI